MLINLVKSCQDGKFPILSDSFFRRIFYKSFYGFFFVSVFHKKSFCSFLKCFSSHFCLCSVRNTFDDPFLHILRAARSHLIIDLVVYFCNDQGTHSKLHSNQGEKLMT